MNFIKLTKENNMRDYIRVDLIDGVYSKNDGDYNSVVIYNGGKNSNYYIETPEEVIEKIIRCKNRIQILSGEIKSA